MSSCRARRLAPTSRIQGLQRRPAGARGSLDQHCRAPSNVVTRLRRDAGSHAHEASPAREARTLGCWPFALPRLWDLGPPHALPALPRGPGAVGATAV